MIRTSYNHQNRTLPAGSREPIVVGTADKPQTPQGQLVRGLIKLGDQFKKTMASLNVSVEKHETISVKGDGGSSSDGAKFVFAGPDAAKLQGMENTYQEKANGAFDQKFATYASEKLGTDFNSLSADDQAKFRAENVGQAGLIRSTVDAEMGPSPQQQVIAQNQELLRQGVKTETVQRTNLPVINPGN